MPTRGEYHSSEHLWRGPDAITDLRKFYVEPLAPAATPDDYVAGDDLYTSWEGPWANISVDRPASAYSFAVGGDPKVRICATGGEGVENSTMFFLPEIFRPVGSVIVRATAQVGLTGEGLAAIDIYPDDGAVVFVRMLVLEP